MPCRSTKRSRYSGNTSLSSKLTILEAYRSPVSKTDRALAKAPVWNKISLGQFEIRHYVRVKGGRRVMKRASGLLLIPLLASCAPAQDDLPSADVFFGFSALRANSAQTILAHTSLGGVGTLAWNINEHIGVEAEFGGYHDGLVSTYHNDTNSVTYLLGPRLSYGRLKRFDPYVHALFGGIHAATGILNYPLITQNTPRHTVSQDGFAMAIGGGLDIWLQRYVSFRPVQFDYVPTMLGNIGPTGPYNNAFRTNFRVCIGFVFHDYERW